MVGLMGVDPFPRTELIMEISKTIEVMYELGYGDALRGWPKDKAEINHQSRQLMDRLIALIIERNNRVR